MKVGRKTKGTDMALPDSDVTAITRFIRKNGKVNIGGLGTFEVIKIKPRTLYHNTAKKTITTKGHNKLKYTPALTLKSFINS